MDKGKNKVDEWTSSEYSDSGSNIGPLKKQRVDYDALLEKEERKTEYWRNACIEQHNLHMNFSKWVMEEMDKMVAKHQSQLLSLKNSAAHNRLYFNQLGHILANQIEDAFRQVSDSFYGTEWLAQDFIRDTYAPRFEKPKEPSMPTSGGEKVPLTETHPLEGGTFEVHPSSTMPMKNPREDGSGPSKIARKPRMRTLSILPTIRHSEPEKEDPLAWVERYFGTSGAGAAGDLKERGVGGIEVVNVDDDSDEEEDPEEDPNYQDD